ncbi:PadR family transcriptional regulator [Streptomyces sp. NPDC058773]|uniref:PadR family transcriptional regulator n=1 Tax=Streptomyces sp. NPDC058773 TaxID=3346632 RepID=UPI0036B77CD8
MSKSLRLRSMLAANGPASGYELAKQFDSSINLAWRAKHSQIYPELARMVASDAATVEDTGDTRRRKVYTITDTGRQEITQWLTGEETSSNVRSELALRAFLVGLLDPAQAAELIRQEADRLAAQLQQLEGLRSALDESAASQAPFGSYALDLGIRVARARHEWAGDTAADLERRRRAE